VTLLIERFTQQIFIRRGLKNLLLFRVQATVQMRPWNPGFGDYEKIFFRISEIYIKIACCLEVFVV